MKRATHLHDNGVVPQQDFLRYYVGVTLIFCVLFLPLLLVYLRPRAVDVVSRALI